MAALNLFPARVRFVNDDGTLTTEAFRALQIVFNRVGGALGDSGTDVFGQVFGAPSDSTDNLSNALSDVIQGVLAEGLAQSTDVVQSPNFTSDFYSDVVQYQLSSKDIAGNVLPDVVQPLSKDRESGAFTTIDVFGNATIGGTLSLAAGTVGLPSLYWGSDTTTGFYRVSANCIGFSVSGTQVLDLRSTGVTLTGNTTLTASIDLATSGSGGQINYYGDASGFYEFVNRMGAAKGFRWYTGAGASVIGMELSSAGRLKTVGGAAFMETSTALTNGAGAGAGTITNAPAAGNPTKWIGINDNGTTRYIPAW